MTMRREIRFTLNKRPVRASVESHSNIVELLHELGFFGARESCGQGLCG
jgi:aerobic-type carbon monoxide dehydrogenase small subunit (CoxS/CutS family)